MLTTISHLGLSLMLSVGALATYGIWRDKKFKQDLIVYFFVFYLFFIGYNLSLSLPFLFFSGNLTALAWGYNLAVVFLFLLFIMIFKLEADIYGLPREQKKRYLGLAVFAGVFVLALQISDLRLPVIQPSGIIIWNTNLAAGWVTAVMGLMPGVILVVEFIKISTSRLDRLEKLKEFLLGSGSLVMGLAGLAYFPARGQWQVIAAFVLISLGIFLFTSAFLLPKKDKK